MGGGDGSINERAIQIASLAVQAILYEVSCYPSPGLVSKVSCGAHSDMDYFTFLDSSAALISPLLSCAEAGFSGSSPPEIFSQIRRIGRLGERQMYAKTGGVNTHKGALFLLGICCAAGGKTLYLGNPFSSLPGLIQEMTKGLVARELSSKVREFEYRKSKNTGPISELTHGESLFLTHGVEGIRGEVERGLPVVFKVSLAAYRENQDLGQNLRLVQTLLTIMQFCEDTNIIHRHSLETLREVQSRVKRIIALGGMRTSAGVEAVQEMDEDFRRCSLSPGGSADLLAVTVFLDLLESYMSE